MLGRNMLSLLCSCVLLCDLTANVIATGNSASDVTNAIVFEDGLLTLQCKVEQGTFSGVTKFQWMRNNVTLAKVITQGGKQILQIEDDNFENRLKIAGTIGNLHLAPVKRTDAGVYVCVTDAANQTEVVYNVTVYVEPYAQTMTCSDNSEFYTNDPYVPCTNFENNVTLTCEVNSYPGAQISWVPENEECIDKFEVDQNICTRNEYTYECESGITTGCSGKYKCVAVYMGTSFAEQSIDVYEPGEYDKSDNKSERIVMIISYGILILVLVLLAVITTCLICRLKCWVKKENDIEAPTDEKKIKYTHVPSTDCIQKANGNISVNQLQSEENNNKLALVNHSDGNAPPIFRNESNNRGWRKPCMSVTTARVMSAAANPNFTGNIEYEKINPDGSSRVIQITNEDNQKKFKMAVHTASPPSKTGPNIDEVD